MKRARMRPLQEARPGTSLTVQWLGLHAFTAEGVGSIPGRGAKIPQAERRGPQKKLFFYCGFRWPPEAKLRRNKAKQDPSLRRTGEDTPTKKNTHRHTQNEPSARREKLPGSFREAGSYLHFWAG